MCVVRLKLGLVVICIRRSPHSESPAATPMKIRLGHITIQGPIGHVKDESLLSILMISLVVTATSITNERKQVRSHKITT